MNVLEATLFIFQTNQLPSLNEMYCIKQLRAPLELYRIIFLFRHQKYFTDKLRLRYYAMVLGFKRLEQIWTKGIKLIQLVAFSTASSRPLHPFADRHFLKFLCFDLFVGSNCKSY